MRRMRKHAAVGRPASTGSQRAIERQTDDSASHAHSVVALHEERRGVALVVVAALLGLLALLGFFFYTFARQENANAEYFAATAKEFQDPGIDPDVFFNWALKQIIIGGPSYLEHSALFGGRHALIPNMFGRDAHPFSGRGIHLINSGTGQPVVDQDFDNVSDDGGPAEVTDGLLDVSQQFLNVNDSPAANNYFLPYNGEDVDGDGLLDAGEDLNLNGELDPPYPSPDVDYTAPDINNLYLAYRGFGLNGLPPAAPVQVIIPSYHRPQYLRAGGVHIADWYQNAATEKTILRPHPLHRFIPDNGLDGFPGVAGFDDDGDGETDEDDEFGFPGSDDGISNGMRRFLDPNNAADALVIANLPLLSGGFPFIPADDAGGNGGVQGEMGVWSGSTAGIYELDANADGDPLDIREAIWMDLDFPQQELPDGSAKFIPLFAVTIIDADALFNMNVHGNAEGFVNFDTPTDAFGTNGALELLSQSNMGVAPTEVNPQWALTADTTAIPLADLQQHQYMYDPGNLRFDIAPADGIVDATMTWQELANMEFFNSLVGRPEYQSATVIDEYHTGRWGEVSRLANAVTTRAAADFSAAGGTNIDDNGNLDLGEVTGFANFIHPIDFRGLGEWFDPALDGKQPLDYTLADTLNRWIRYQGFETGGGVLWAQPSVIMTGASRLVADGTGNLMQTLGGLPVLPGNATNALMDEPFEGLDGSSADEAFGPSENPYLQLSDTDIVSASIASRLATLMPYNLETDPRAYDIRQMLTASSRDIKSLGRTWYGDNPATLPANLAAWESGVFDEDLVAGDDTNRFYDPALPADPINLFNSVLSRFVPSYEDRFINDATPGVFAGEPFRPQLARWLEVVANETDFAPNPLRQRLMSINRVIENYAEDPAAPGPTEAVWPFGPDGQPGEAGKDDNGEGVDDNGDTTVDEAAEIDDIEEFGAEGSDDLSPLRALTDHANDPGYDNSLGVTSIPIGLPTAPHPGEGVGFGTNSQEQEAWARFDRQMMARDIYVMLYTFGGGQDIDYRADNSGNALYTDAQCREMAQFAVNVVDALDRDFVITAFEYDTNLHDGWNPDDNPYNDQTAAELGPDGAAGAVGVDDDGDGRVDFLAPGIIDYKEYGFGDDIVGIVHGVEAQSLTISEALFVRANQVDDGMGGGQDLNVTQHNDSVTSYFSFMELRNASPFPVTFDNGASGTTDNGVWQIEMSITDTVGMTTTRRQLTLRADDIDFGSAPISAGGLYSIMTDDSANLDPIDGTTVLPSHFVIDQDFVDGTTVPPDNFNDNILNTIAPSGVTAPGSKPVPGLDLVLEHPTTLADLNPARFTIVDPDTAIEAELAPGAFFDATNVPLNLANVIIELRLRRRAHPGRAAYAETEIVANIGAYDLDNPWIDVDSATFTLGNGLVDWTLDRTLHNDGFEVKQQLVVQNMKSNERHEPLNRNQEEVFPTTLVGTEDYTLVPDADVRLNSVGSDNASSLANPAPRFDSWQPHFDRDFASVMELLAVPLFSPDELTDGPDNAGSITALTASGLDAAGTNSAGKRKFLQTDDWQTLGAVDQLDNRWYRLLGMVEVPTLVNDAVEIRAQGRLNWNTLRNPEVLAGLVDDPNMYTLNVTTLTLADPNEGGRDWWQQFLQARDGVDDAGTAGVQRGVDPTTGFVLPGLPGAQPFRSFQFSADSLTSLEHTMLRGLPLDSGLALDPTEYPTRRLFEVGTQAERFGAVGADETEDNEDDVDFYTRNRLLSKIAGNSTTRSNVFFVFIQVDYFESIEDQFGPDGGPGAVGVDDNGDTVVDDSAEAGWPGSDETGADGQPGVAGVDDNGDTVVDDVVELGWPGSDDIIAIRIGGMLADSPGHRGFFVIDRSVAYDLLKAGDFRSPQDPSKFSIKAEFEGGFDFRNVITYRKILN